MRTNFWPDLRFASVEDATLGHAGPIDGPIRSWYRAPFLAPRRGKITVHGFDENGSPTKSEIVVPAPRPD